MTSPQVYGKANLIDRYPDFFCSQPVSVWGPAIGLSQSQIDAFRVENWKRGVGEHIVQSQRYSNMRDDITNVDEARYRMNWANTMDLTVKGTEATKVGATEVVTKKPGDSAKTDVQYPIRCLPGHRSKRPCSPPRESREFYEDHCYKPN